MLPCNDGMCAAWVVHDGERLRRRTDRERERYRELGGTCPYACEPRECVIEDGADPRAEHEVRVWSRCGGSARWCWPRAGGALDQDAAELFRLELIDAEVRGGQRHAE